MHRRLKLSSATLVAANLVPLAGVLMLDWSVSSVVILYWFENVVIGTINVARMLTYAPGNSLRDSRLTLAVSGIKLFLIPFFIFHYFFFCAGHGVFVFGMFPDEDGFFPDTDGFELLSTLFRAVEIFSTPLAFAAVALTLSHIISFVVNYLGGREYEKIDLRRLMTLPYGRIVVLHLTIIFGGFITMAFDEPLGVIVILVVVKMAVDLKMHLKEHLKLFSRVVPEKVAPSAAATRSKRRIPTTSSSQGSR